MNETILNPDMPFVPHQPPRWMAPVVIIAAVVVISIWLLGTPAGVEGKADAIGYAICHQIVQRTFDAGGVLMPLCARCSGIYLGVMTSFLIAVASGRARVRMLPPLRVSIVLGVFVVAMGIDGLNSYGHLFPGFTGIYEPQNWLRLVTGMYCGITMFNLIFPVFNQVVWHSPDERHNIANLRELAGVCIAGAVVILLVLTERPIFLLVFGLVSTVGVVLILSMVGTVLFLSITHMDRSAIRWRQLAIPMLAGLTLAMIQIGTIDVIRLALTHTWSGFTIPG